MNETATLPARRPDRVHRVVTLATIVVLSAGTFNGWHAVVQLRWAATASSLAMVAALVLGALAATALTLRELHFVDVGVLLFALYVVGVWLVFNLYFHTGQLVLFPSSHSTRTAAIATATALCVATVLAHALSPVQWKSLGVLGCVGLPVTFGFGDDGLDATVVLPFMVLGVAGWARTGELGVLGLPGALRGMCLGCAAAAHPLGWVAVPLLVTCVWQLRRGDVPARAATRVVLRFTCVVAVTLFLVNATRGGAVLTAGSPTGLLSLLVPMWTLFVSTVDRRDLARAFVHGTDG